MPDRVICQWDKDSCDDARFIKIDFLALGMLSLVEETVELIARREGTPPDLSRIDFNDPVVYDRICAGDTVGLFQIESRAQIQMIRRTRPRNLEDLAVEVAIVRPGPIVGGAVNPYVRRREAQRHAGQEGRRYDPPVDHPLLKECLGETLGVILYQDQVLQVCQALAGFTAGQAEALRRAMSRRRSRELMEGFWEEFQDGAARRGVPESVAKHVFEQVIAFSEFGFPKSHAAAFGLLAYQSAWLRHYYPVEYYAGLFNNQPMGFYSLDALGRDAGRHGIEIRLPEANLSDVYCTVEYGVNELTGGVRVGGSPERALVKRAPCKLLPVGALAERPAREEDPTTRPSAVRVGLAFLREWSEDTAEQLVLERETNGPFTSLGNLVRRAPPRLSRNAIEHLVWVGGCDAFGLTRRELLWQVGLWLPPKHQQRDPARVRHQLELPLEHPYEHLAFGALEAHERLLTEYQVLGFAAGGHPFQLLRGSLPPGLTPSARLATLEHHSRVEVAGLVVARQRPHTAKGFVFVLMEDESGMINAIVRPDVYERDRVAIRSEPFLWIQGTLAKDDGSLNVIAEEVRALKVRPHTTSTTRTMAGDASHPLPPQAVDGDGGRGKTMNPYSLLKNLRSSAPDAKSWG
jgi:error-prone DNA polymerase